MCALSAEQSTDWLNCSIEPEGRLSEVCVTAWPSGLHAMVNEWSEYEASPAGCICAFSSLAMSNGQQGTASACSTLCMQSEEWRTPRGNQGRAAEAMLWLAVHSSKPPTPCLQRLAVSSAYQSCMLNWRHGAAATWQGPTAWAPCGRPQWLRRGWPAPSLVHRLAVHCKGAAAQPERQQK